MARIAPLRAFIAAAALALATLVLVAPVSIARGMPEVTLADLPSEAREVIRLIHGGGPFRYERDGVVFGNREKLLSPQPRGYYHEYTVPTPHAKDRGARRIVCGGPKRSPDACFYSDDHYASFRRIRE